MKQKQIKLAKRTIFIFKANGSFASGINTEPTTNGDPTTNTISITLTGIIH